MFPGAMAVEVPPVKNEHILEAQSTTVVGDTVGAIDEGVAVLVGTAVVAIVEVPEGGTAGRNCSGEVVGYPEVSFTNAIKK
jgi:hypothetical protein